MRRLLLLLLLASPMVAQGQTTTTTGTIVDGNGNPYSNGTASAQKAVASGQVQPPPVNVTTNGSGTFSMVLPSPASYIFTICAPPTQIGPTGNPTPTSVCFNNTAPVAISGTSQDVSSSLNAVAKVLGPNITGVSGVVANCTANQVPFYAVNGNVVACSSVITISGVTATVQNETVTGNAAITGTFSVGSTATVTGALTLSAGLTAAGFANLNGGANINSGLTVNGGSTLNGGGSDSGAWTHSGNHTFNGATLTVNSNTTENGSLTTLGALTPKLLDNIQIVDSTFVHTGGSDMGAEINATYAACPASGCTIVIMPGPVGSCYSYSTPIVAATSGKYLRLEAWGASGATGLSTIFGCLNYVPVTATSAITLDYVPTAQSPLSSAHGLRNITLTNNSCVTSGGCGSLATGINTGTTNAGTYGATMDNVGISGFGVGYKNTNNLSVQVHWNNPQFFFNTVAAKTDLMTGFWIFGGQVAGNAVGMQASGGSSGTEYLFYGTSFFANTGLEFDMTPSTAIGSLGCFGCHFEKGPSSANARFINGPLNILLSGGVMEQDKTTGTDDWMINASGSFLDVEGMLFLASDTITSVIVANSPVRGQFNGSIISQGHFTNRITGANAANISDCSFAGSSLGHPATPCYFEAPLALNGQSSISGVAGQGIFAYSGATGFLTANLNNTGNHKVPLTESGSCAMSAGTTCTFSTTVAFSGTPFSLASIDAASTVPATANSAKCSVSGTTVTITAGIANSLTWDCLLVGNPN